MTKNTRNTFIYPFVLAAFAWVLCYILIAYTSWSIEMNKKAALQKAIKEARVEIINLDDDSDEGIHAAEQSFTNTQ
jgi:hypothetical protein